MPIYFTKEEIATLKDLTKNHEGLHAKLANIQAGTYYQSYMETIKEDVLMVIENNGYGDVSEEDLERIVLQVSNYDASDYNDFIDETINDVLGG